MSENRRRARMRWRSAVPIVLAFVYFGVAGCQSEPETSGDDPALAEVGSRVIRESDLDTRLEAMSVLSRAEYKGKEGRQTLLKRMVEEEAFYQGAKAEGYEKDPTVVQEVERTLRNAMLRKYYEEEVIEKAKPSLEEVEAYYGEHLEEFRVKPRVRVRHIVTSTKAQAERVRELAVMGRDFERLAADHSIDEKTKDKGGLIPGYLSPGYQVPLHGDVDELVEAAMELEEGEVGPVIRTPLGYHVLKAEEVHPGVLVPLDEARLQIERTETERRSAELFEVKYLELAERLNVRFYGEDVEPPTVESLFEKAQNAGSPSKRIEYYEQVLQSFPTDARAYEAQFMIGFVYSEELGDYDQARAAFEAVLANYPESDLAGSAQWMLENMGQRDIPLDEVAMPEGVAASLKGGEQ